MTVDHGKTSMSDDRESQPKVDAGTSPSIPRYQSQELGDYVRKFLGRVGQKPNQNDIQTVRILVKNNASTQQDKKP
jgi:hypothetical protein